ncbi:MAG: ABC transporter permease subunit [Gammaproteobacteria bacterium]
MSANVPTIATGAADRKTSPPFNWGPALAVAPLVALLFVAFVWPISSIVGTSFVDGGFTLEFYARALASSVYRQVFVNTLLIAGLVTIGTLVISYPFAYVMATTPPAIVKILAFVVLLPFWTSALVRTTAWIIVLQRNGILNSLLTSSGLTDQPVAFLYNLQGVLVGMIHVLMPFMVFPLYAAFRAIEGSLVEAAEGLGAGALRIFIRIIAPLSAPGVAAGTLIVFMSAIGYYITPSLMGGPRQTMIAQMISYHMMERLDWGMASALALILLVATIVIFAIFQRLFGFDRLYSGAGISGTTIEPAAGGRSPVRWATVAAAVAAAVFLIVPILLVFPLSLSSSPFVEFPPDHYTFRWYVSLTQDPKWLRAFVSSLQVAAMVVVASLALGTAAAIGLSRLRSRLSGLLEAFFLTPMVVSPIVIAIGLYYFFAPLGMIGSRYGLAIGHALLAAPFVLISVRAVLRNFDENLELAALGLGASWFTMFRRVMIPSIWPGVLGGGVFAFIVSFDDVVLALFLTNVHSRTLPKVIYEGIKHDIDPTIVAVAALLIVVSLLVLCVSLLLGRRR